jgi:hypothetical protein
MSETAELDVVSIAYAGPHCVEPDTYEIVVQVKPAPGAPAGLVALRLRRAEAALLALAMQANPPDRRLDADLLDRVAAHDT